MATVYGGTVKSWWRTWLTYSTTTNNGSITVTWSYGIQFLKQIKGNNDTDGNYQSQYDRPTYCACSGQTTQYRYPTAKFTKNWWNSGGSVATYGTGSFSVPRRTSGYSVTLSGYIYHNSSSTTYSGASLASASIWIPALPTYTISFDKGTQDDVTGMPNNITKYYGVNITLPPAPSRDGYAFQSWSGYSAGATYSGNANATLTAIWGAADPPTCDVGDVTLSTSSDNVIRSFTDITCDIDNIEVYHDRELDTTNGVRMMIAGIYSNAITSGTSGTLTILGQDDGVPTFSVEHEGLQKVYIVTEDNAQDGHAIGKYEIGEVNIVSPTWEKDITINVAFPPSEDQNGNAILDSLEIYNYASSSWETVDKSSVKIAIQDSSWSFGYVFDENHVSDALSDTPNIDVRVAYKHYDTDVPIGSQAFFSTTRNQNYSNGIYNVMFVGGVDNTQFPEYTSRVWWCKINDPLYFPDTNYIEVGSNDTAVQGLTKVGDYLAVVKQSKTTDTAIFLLYPTSFEEETTYAVKQGVQGVGALSRYSFNILGDETLFLSPKGVVAVVPTQDEEHKVQNRSYFVDKRLLAEDAKEAYSFVHDGKYFLAIGNGHVYVLDGNQRNSWGNDKTVLVYECYYLENIPAKCFVKFQDTLVFSDDTNVCIFTEGYVDAYDGDEENVPVKAEWSTIFDDDGSLHYYKTMQKKGNLVSILPIENELPYMPISVDEETFNADKTHYWILEDGKYIQCTESDEYSADTQYYIENRSNTKVLVKKDDKDPVEIERKFGLNSNIPSELFINKKFKKYKRLQFILRNEADEDFGIDEIVKNYTVGNYAKK